MCSNEFTYVTLYASLGGQEAKGYFPYVYMFSLEIYNYILFYINYKRIEHLWTVA
jgi:hypothetical protein